MISNKFSGDFSENSISQKLIKLKEDGIDILNLIESNPTACDFEYNKELIINSFKSKNNLKYEPVPGGSYFVKEKISGLNRKNISINDITLTAGTSESYSYLFKLLSNPGDNVLIPKPSYPLLDILCDLESLEIRYYNIVYNGNKWEIDFDSIIAQTDKKTKSIIIINPNNPTGNFFSKADSDFLTEYSNKNNIALIIDEVFNDFNLSEKKFSFIEADIFENSSLFVLNGISKMLALPQMKLGWIINLSGNKVKSTYNNILEMVADSYYTVNTPVQNAFPNLLQTGYDIRTQILKRIISNYNFLRNHFNDDPLNKVLHVEGGWYAIIKSLSQTGDEERVLYFLENYGVNLHPGYFYNFDEDGFFILSLIVKESIFRSGVKRIFK